MKPIDAVLAMAVAIIWGVAFSVSKIGLQEFSPSQLTALRFVVASIAVICLPRPSVPVWMLIGIGMTVFAGQFLLQFFGLAYGMPAGLTAVTVQMQALFTVLIAATFLGEKPGFAQTIGMTIALGGLALISFTLEAAISLLAFLLTLASALSWAAGNILIKRLRRTDMLRLMVWASLVPPIPSLLVSSQMDSSDILSALASASWAGVMAAIYLGLIATVVAYAIWGSLLQRYPAGSVAPFALLVPGVGAVTSALVFGESFDAVRITGMILIIAGVGIAATGPSMKRKNSP